MRCLWKKRVGAALVALAFAGACTQRADVRKLRFMENGRRFYDSGDYSRAIIQWKNAVEVANGDPEPFYWLGMGYMGAGNIPLAVDSFRKAAELNPNHAAAQLRMAELLTLSDDPAVLQDALKRLQIVLNTSPSARALDAIALTELKLGNDRDSQSYLEDALARFPQSMSSYVILAKLKILKQDLAGAEDVLKRAVTASPNSADARLALANFYWATNRAQEAEKLMREALDLDKKSGMPLFDLAMLEYQTGRKSEAERDFRQLSANADPELKPMHAIYLFKEGDKQGAIAELEKLTRDNPKALGIRSRLLAAYWATGRLDQVERVLNDALKKQPKDLQALLQRGELYTATDRFPQAEADLEKVLSLRPDAAVVHFVLAKLQQVRGSDAGFRQELQEALRLNPGLLQARLDLARRLTESGAPDSAIKVLDEAPVTDKSNVALLTERNWALLEAKDYGELEKNLKAELGQARQPELLAQEGWLKITQRDYVAARAAIEEGLKKAPSDIRLLSALAAVYTSQNKTSEFTERLRQYAQGSSSAAVQFFAGDWLRQIGDRAGARAFLLAAKAADPAFHEADLALAELDIADGKLDSARTLLNQLAALRDRDVSLRARIAELEVQRKHVPEAIDQYRKIITADRNNVYALNNLAYLLASQNQADEALAYAQQAKELAPTLPQVDDTLGWVLYHKAVYGEAVMHLEAAAKKSSDPAIEYHLGLAYFKTGNSERGAQLLKQALKQAPNMEEAKLARQQMGIE
ncbi:MAG TPA: tetratricopeptide repeat protein [Bryobacteraceae bacterium]|nr:tetratricopeptide repeat protein [Bryobacteraceae bacterium]